jgi:hypothetical protein
MKEQHQQHSFLEDPQPAKEPGLPGRRTPHRESWQLREAIAPYLDVPKLRQLASDHERLEEALRTGDIPEEISWLLSLLTTVLAPIERVRYGAHPILLLTCNSKSAMNVRSNFVQHA